MLVFTLSCTVCKWGKRKSKWVMHAAVFIFVTILCIVTWLDNGIGQSTSMLHHLTSTSCIPVFRGYNQWIMSTERDGNMNAVDFSSRAPSERSTASKTKALASCVPPKRYLCPPFVSILFFRQMALLAFRCKWLSVDPWMHVCVFSGAAGEFQQWGGGLVECPAVSSGGGTLWSGAWRSFHHPLHGP